jgi:octaheme c-type cytochrome (tetrathionate reductase family)
MTIAIVSSILFCYRLLVTFFPILPGYVPATAEQLARLREERTRTVSPRLTWVIRASAVAVLFGFVLTYYLVHRSAVEASEQTVAEVQRVIAAEPVHVEAPAGEYPLRPDTYRKRYLLSNPMLNTASDDYEPVAFAHRIHDELTGGDCGVCHHRYSWDEDDRVGEGIAELHESIEVPIGGPCADCHADMTENPPQSCTRCHGLPNEVDAPARLGLKGAYHRQCIGCHERHMQPAPAPTECNSCHHPWTPDHALLVDLPEQPSPQETTRTCLACHSRVGDDLLATAHWNWKGQSPTLVGYQHRTDVSLQLMINNYCIAIGSNPQACATCHIGYGWVDEAFDFSDPSNIDCLVCHDTTATYRKDPLQAGMPVPEVDLGVVARSVGRPSRATCGSCHFQSGGAPNAKHGDLEPALAAPSPELDQHMGRRDMRCQDCHTTTRHRIAGMSMTAPALEGRVTCEQCHGNTPHGVVGMLGQHLDDHVRTIACETCHIPFFARSTPTLLRRDFSAAGQDRPEELDRYGMPTYDRRFGTLSWGMNQVPVYLWFDGTRRATLVGDKVSPARGVVLNPPSGDKRNPAARIFPFKAHTAVQPCGLESRVLAIPKLSAAYWADFSWERAISDGMTAMGLEYSGRFGWVETTLYTGIHHSVGPAATALGCTDCHSAEAANCVRCHRGAKGMDRPEHTRKVYPDVDRFLDFGALGYQGDPALTGGRFFVTLGRGLPPR